MGKLNSTTIAATLYNGVSELAGETFQKAFGLLAKAFSQRLQIERESLGDAFDADVFWSDNGLAENVIMTASKRPKLKKGTTEPMLRKGQPVYQSTRMNARVIASAASIIRSGVRSVRALGALTRRTNSLEQAVIDADKLGNVLSMVRRLAQAGLCADNRAANDAKNAAIAGYVGETPSSSARKALIASLYGQPVTTAQVKQLGEALTQFGEDVRTARKIVTDSRPYVAPAPLTFAGVFGTVVQITRKPRASRRTVAPVVETPQTGDVSEPAVVNA